MKEEDADRLLDDLRLLEPLLDGNREGISGGRKVFAAALLRGMDGIKTAEPRLTHSLKALCFAVRGCYEGSNQCDLLMQVLAQTQTVNAQELAAKALWSRAHEALAELRVEMDKFRRRSS